MSVFEVLHKADDHLKAILSSAGQSTGYSNALYKGHLRRLLSFIPPTSDHFTAPSTVIQAHVGRKRSWVPNK